MYYGEAEHTKLLYTPEVVCVQCNINEIKELTHNFGHKSFWRCGGGRKREI